MADETLLRDRVEIERQRDAFSRLDRINGVEKDVAVLRTLFDATIKSILEKLAGAVSDDDLTTLKREMEAEMNKQITHICDHMDAKNEQQSERIVSRVETMLNNYQNRTTEERLAQSNSLLQANENTKKEIIRYGIGFALTVLSGLVMIWMTAKPN